MVHYMPQKTLQSSLLKVSHKFKFYQVTDYLVVIALAQGICLIYIPKPEGRRLEGAGMGKLFHQKHKVVSSKTVSV